MRVIRMYKNGTDTIRMDTISITPNHDWGKIATFQADNGMGLVTNTYRSEPQIFYVTGVARTVDGIEVIGDYDAVETVSGNYEWVTKTLGSGQILRIDMSDLPGIGDSV